MATYTKPTITISGETLMGTSFSGDANAFESFEHHKTIKADNDVLIPFHTVKKAVKNVTSAEAEKADPYGCDNGGETKGEVWYTGTVGECQNGYASATLEETDKANLADLIANYESYSVDVNGIEMKIASEPYEDNIDYTDTGSFTEFNSFVRFFLNSSSTAAIKCPTDITTVEVTVAKK